MDTIISTPHLTGGCSGTLVAHKAWLSTEEDFLSCSNGGVHWFDYKSYQGVKGWAEGSWAGVAFTASFYAVDVAGPDTPADPPLCPDEYDLEFNNKTLQIYARFVVNATTTDVLLGEYGWNDLRYNHHTWTLPFSFSVLLEGDFEYHAELVESAFADAENYGAYTADYDPFGLPIPKLRYYYVPPAALDITITCDSVVVATDTYVPVGAEFEQGIVPVGVKGGTDIGIDCLTGMADEDDWIEAVNLSLDGPAGGMASQTLPYPAAPAAKMATWNVVGRVMSITAGGESHDCELTVWRGGFTAIHAGNVGHQDNVDVAGATIQASDGPTSENTDASGDVSIEYTYDGNYRWGRDTGFPGGWYGVDVQEPLGRANLYTEHSARLTNCLALDEPDYPAAAADAEPDENNEDAFADKRIEYNTPVYTWSAALRVTAPNSRDALTFDGTEFASWTPTSTVVLSNDAGKLKIEGGASGGTCSRDYTGDGWTLAGSRYVDVVYTSDDAAAITITIDGRDYSITPGANRIDLLSIEGAGGGADALQSTFDVDPTWGWGVHDPKVIELSGLRASKTYTLEKLTQIRLAAVDGGFMEVYLAHGGFVACAPGDPRTSDPYTLFVKPGGADSLCYGRKGLVIVDGIVAAELFDVKHDTIPAMPADTWRHTPIGIGDADLIWPTGGLVSVAVGAGADWQDGTVPATYLTGHTDVDHNNIDLNIQGLADTIRVPYGCTASTSFSFVKRLRGMGYVRIVDADGTPAAGATVTVTTTRKAGGGSIAQQILTADAMGHLLSPSLRQPVVVRAVIDSNDGTDTIELTTILPYSLTGMQVWFPLDNGDNCWRTVTSHTAGSPTVVLSSAWPSAFGGAYLWIITPYSHTFLARLGTNEYSGDLLMRNRNISLLTLRLGPTTPEGKNSDLLFDGLRGLGQLAYSTQAGSLLTARTFNNGVSYETPFTLSASGTADNPCVVRFADAYGSWAVVWNEGDDLAMARSGDGFATYGLEALMTGARHARIVTNHLTGIALLVAWRVADGKLICQRSFDHGVSWVPVVPVEIGAFTEQAFGLTCAPTAMGTWCLSVTDGAGAVVTYWSTDNGLTWSLAA